MRGGGNDGEGTLFLLLSTSQKISIPRNPNKIIKKNYIIKKLI